ncbi:MAG: NADH-quinone oxidoreductase subunit C [Pirellulales bacterium]
MSSSSFLDQLKARFGDQVTGANLEAIDPWIEVSPEGLIDLCGYLRDEPKLRFDMLSCITAVDYFAADPKAAEKIEGGERIEVVYHLWSVPHKNSLVVKVLLPRWRDGVAGQLPEVPSVSPLWSTADWHERETYDLSGIYFVGHPNLRRILCPEDWVGYPLRKDYEMPLEYHGIRCR